MRASKLGLMALSALVLAACATTPATPGRTYVLVRHAEKAADDPRDPSLSPAGVARAQRLAGHLHALPVDAVYATAYRRTQQTAAPTAADHWLDVRSYDAAMQAPQFAARLLAAPERTVLVVGHSNTIPELAAALCGCAVAPISEHEFGRRITVRVGPGGVATLDDRTEP